MTRSDALDHEEDLADFADEMERQGADPDAVARLREELEDDDEDEDEEDDDEPPLELWPENEEAFRVFAHCKWDREIVAGLDRTITVYSGIPGSEIRSICELLAVPADRMAHVLTQVRIAESVAHPLLNERT